MYMTMTMMRPSLFFQREGPGSEPGNSLVCPDEAACSVCGVLGMNQFRASLLRKQPKQNPSRINRTVQPALTNAAHQADRLTDAHIQTWDLDDCPPKTPCHQARRLLVRADCG